jgi:hypothetical protein
MHTKKRGQKILHHVPSQRLHLDFATSGFLSSKAHSLTLDSYPRLFSNIKFELADIFKFEGHSVYYQNMQKDFFVELEPNNELFLVGLWSSCTHTYFSLQ